MADKLMYIPNNDTQNYLLCRFQLRRLDTQLNEPTGQIQQKSPKLLSQRKLYCITLGTSVINSPLSTPSLVI